MAAPCGDDELWSKSWCMIYRHFCQFGEVLQLQHGGVDSKLLRSIVDWILLLYDAPSSLPSSNSFKMCYQQGFHRLKVLRTKVEQII